MKAIIAALLLAPTLACAQWYGTPERMGVHTLTRHDPGLGANDLNFGAYVKTDRGFVAGGYHNSWHRMAYYAGWQTPEWYRMRIAVVGVTGYFAPVTLVAVPTLRVWTFDNGATLNVSGGPRLTETGQGVLHATVEWGLK